MHTAIYTTGFIMERQNKIRHIVHNMKSWDDDSEFGKMYLKVQSQQQFSTGTETNHIIVMGEGI
jgi:hypothetical protein